MPSTSSAIVYRIDDQRRVEVAADQFDQAADVVAKLDLGQRSIDEIRDDPGSTQSVGRPGRARTEGKAEARADAGAADRRAERGALGVGVDRSSPPVDVRSQQAAKPSAFVYVETDGGRALPSRSVQAILSLLDGLIPGLVPGSITVMDHRGMRYLDPGNPALGDHSRNRAREEEITEEILEKLDWIKGVRVQVQVITPHAGELGRRSRRNEQPPPRARRTGRAASHARPDGRRLGRLTNNRAASEPLMAANRPLAIDADRRAGPCAPSGCRALLKRQAAAAKVAGLPRAGDRVSERARAGAGHSCRGASTSTWRSAAIRASLRREELRAMAERTEKSIRTAVALLLPDSDSWKVEVGTIAGRGVAQPAGDSSRGGRLAPPVAGMGNGRRHWGLAYPFWPIAGSWIRMARRPARLPEPSDRSRRYHAGSALQPSPSERVRELIQRNPEAAASVLQRWVGQGGRSA